MAATQQGGIGYAGWIHQPGRTWETRGDAGLHLLVGGAELSDCGGIKRVASQDHPLQAVRLITVGKRNALVLPNLGQPTRSTA
jgi:hypothetical protein